MPAPVTEENLSRNALAVQIRLRKQARAAVPVAIDAPTVVIGADAAYRGNRVVGAAVALTYPALRPLCASLAVKKVTFPYVSGLFAFREGPVILKAVRGLSGRADLLFINGHGDAHPRRFGMATHLGLLLDIPSVGIARRPMAESGANREADHTVPRSLLMGNEEVGRMLHLREGGGTVCVSAGYRTRLEDAIRWAAGSTREHRFPEPLVLAHRLAGCMAQSLRD